MKQLVCTILVFLLCHAYIGTSYADVSTPEIISKIKNCLEAKNPRSITEYVCTKGDFVQETEQPLRDEETAYLVIMSIKFNDIDRQVLKEMEKLQKSRMTDGMSWVDYIHTAIGAYGVQYLSVCTALGGNLSIVALWKKDLRTLPTLNAFPQNFCRDLAMRKAAAWENMGYILASKGSSKGFQNSKDNYISTLRGRYKKLSEKVGSYAIILATAVTKFTAYIKNPL